MASLIDWLAFSGARTSAGAAVASGKAYFYQPGTTATQVPVYSDADGLIAITQPVTLDAGGRAAVYADAPYYIAIQDSTGASVRLADRGNTVTASQVEIQNTVATGTSLTTGSQVAGGRTDLNVFLTSLRASLGAIDGKVDLDGTPTLIKNALHPLANFYDITSPAYGANGDGIADDTVPIQAAIDAAVAAGGVVLVPPGTYKLTAALTSINKVLILGANPHACVFRMDTDGVRLFDSTDGLAISGITLTTAASGVGAFLVDLGGAGSTTLSHFDRCVFTQPDATVNASSIFEGVVTCVGCTFSDTPLTVVAGSHVTILGGLLATSAAAETYLFPGSGASVIVEGAEFRATAASGTQEFMNGSADGVVVLRGCDFRATSGVALRLVPTFTGTGAVIEDGCRLGTNVTLNKAPRWSSWRDRAYLRTSGSATTYAPDSAVAQFHEVISTGASFEWSTPTNPPPSATVAATLVLRYKNTSGGAITPTFSAAYKANAVSVANNSASGWLFVYDATLTAWVQIGSPVAYAS